MDLITELELQIKQLKQVIREDAIIASVREKERYSQINMLELIIENLKKMEQCK